MKIRKELLFGFTLIALLVIATIVVMPAPSEMTNAHLGLLMLSLVVVAIMLGFPTAFTLMGMGVIFTYLAYRHNPELATMQTLDLMVMKGAWAVMTNDVLISVPLFVFMGYLVERAALIEKLFKSLHLAMSWVPGSLAVATLATCALFATATGIVGAVVTLMGLLAFPAMLRAGYDVKLSAGVITAGGCLGILIPPSVLLILYGATAGVSVVQLYAGAFFPGLMLAGMYIGYVVLRAKLQPSLAPKPPPEETTVVLPPRTAVLFSRTGRWAVPGLVKALLARDPGVPKPYVAGQLVLALIPLVTSTLIFLFAWSGATGKTQVDTTGLQELGSIARGEPGGMAPETKDTFGVQEPPLAGTLNTAPGVEEPSVEEPGDEGVAPRVEEPPVDEAGDVGTAPGVEEPPLQELGFDPVAEPDSPEGVEEPGMPEQLGGLLPEESGADAEPPGPFGLPIWFWVIAGIAILASVVNYSLFTFERFQIFKMLLGSFFPLSTLILAVLGAIIFGWATPTEAAALGAAGGMALAAAYRQFKWPVLRESVFLTAKTTAMVCWLFVGSSIFSAAFALLGGQALIESWVLSLEMTTIQFLLLSQFIIFILGWPLEWTEIIVIFMPIFIPLLNHFDVDPLFFGLLVAINLQTAFLSPPVAMAAFYLKGVAPPHVTLGQIFGGMFPYMAIQVVAIFLLYVWPDIGLWLPRVLYR